MERSLTTQTDLENELRTLYRKWPMMKRFLITIGCSGAAAEDVFQEALVIFARKRTEPEFTLTVEPFFYVKNTCKLLWYNEARKQGRNPVFALEKDVEQQDDEWFRKEQQLRQVETVLKRLGAQCQELLQLFYGLGWSMIDIAKKLGLRNDKVAKVQKYRCLEKARNLVVDQEMGEEIIVESENQMP